LGRRRLGEEKKSTVVTATDVRAMSAAATEATTKSSYFASGATSPSPVAEKLSFSSLPSSFTTFLLGMFDSPAYANLTTTYLNEIFNPYTPNDPRVRYFSVAGRTGSLNIWHPLWLPKLVLDGADHGEGHDGLVSVDSACWGEFLGTLEGADHWALRGASGIELGVDLPSVVSDAWGLAHWGRAVRGLRRTKQRTAEEENEGTEGARRASEGRKGDRMAGDERPVSEEELKSSTDRLSAVFDWLVEQVPVASRNAFSFAGDGDGGARGGNSAGSGAGSGAGNNKIPDATGGRSTPLNKRRRDLDSKGDLERLYVALARKLYDEGL
jgi:triacylglycerol lipase